MRSFKNKPACLAVIYVISILFQCEMSHSRQAMKFPNVLIFSTGHRKMANLVVIVLCLIK